MTEYWAGAGSTQLVPEGRETAPKKPQHKNPTEKAPSGQSWNNLNSKMNTDNTDYSLIFLIIA